MRLLTLLSLQISFTRKENYSWCLKYSYVTKWIAICKSLVWCAHFIQLTAKYLTPCVIFNTVAHSMRCPELKLENACLFSVHLILRQHKINMYDVCSMFNVHMKYVFAVFYTVYTCTLYNRLQPNLLTRLRLFVSIFGTISINILERFYQHRFV